MLLLFLIFFETLLSLIQHLICINCHFTLIYFTLHDLFTTKVLDHESDSGRKKKLNEEFLRTKQQIKGKYIYIYSYTY